MSAQKAILCLAAALIAVIAVQVNSSPQPAPYWFGNNGTNKSHDLLIGYRLPGDRMVLRKSVVKNSSWMQVVVVEERLNISYYDRITLIRALDQKTNGNGAYASLTGGGPGNNFANMRYKSQRGHGINFIVEVYARP